MRVLLIIITVLFNISLYSSDIRIVTQDRILERYLKFVNGRDVQEIDSFIGSDRDVAELIFIQQALISGGFKDIKIIGAPTALRVLKMVEEGIGDISGNSFWNSSISEFNIKKSKHIIKNDQFVVGVYVSLENRKALSVKSLEELRKLSFVSSSQWHVDWKTLKDLKIIKLVDNKNWEGMVSMVKLKRVDALLAPFQSTPDLSMNPYGFRMIPIPNIKVALNDFRSVPVSNKVIENSTFLEILDTELDKMLKSGYIKKAYTESGFFNKRVANWKLISLEE